MRRKEDDSFSDDSIFEKIATQAPVKTVSFFWRISEIFEIFQSKTTPKNTPQVTPKTTPRTSPAPESDDFSDNSFFDNFATQVAKKVSF